MREYSFNVDLATYYGVDEAVVIAVFQNIIKNNRAFKRNYGDSDYRVMFTDDYLQCLFPFWKVKKTKQLINKLVEKGVFYLHIQGIGFGKYISFKDEERFIK